MHPREALRTEIKTQLRAALPEHAYVASSLARDIPSSATLAAVVYTPSESIQKISANGEARAGLPVKRMMTVTLMIMAIDSGDGETAMAAADDASRLVEIQLAGSFSNLELTGSSSTVLTGERTGAQVEMIYSITHKDDLRGDHA